MDKRKSILNVTVSVSFKVVITILAIVVKRYLVMFCGNDVNGLNALYISIIGFLAVAELGVGNAITFCMYKPIVEGDTNQVSALYFLFRKLYLIIGGIIFFAGVLVTPFLKYLAKDYTKINQNLYLTFILMLVSIVLTYLFSSKTSLFNAYKNNYITTAIDSGGILLQYILQIAVLFITKSFVAYLVCRIVSVLAQWLVTEIVARKKYNPIIKNKQKLNKETKMRVIRSTKAMFMHNIGYVLVIAADNVVISTYLGVAVLGNYSNYNTILTSMTGILKLVFSSLTSVIGHFFVKATKEDAKKYFEAFYILNFVIGVVFFLGYYAVIDSVIGIIFFEEHVVAKSISFVIAFNGFVQFMREGVLTFRNATGTFYNDRWKPLFEGISNIVLSIIFVKMFGIVGVLVGTIITNLLITHIVEPYVLYKHAFLSSPIKYYIKNYLLIAVFFVVLVVSNFCMYQIENIWLQLLCNGAISLVISAVVCSIILLFNKRSTSLLIDFLKKKK